jgi:hypothetical protein
MKFTHSHPSIDILFPSPLPELASKSLRFSAIQAPNRVLSLWFLTTSIAYSSNKVAGLLRPATDPEVRSVFCVTPPLQTGEENNNRSQNVGFHTLLRIPLASSVLRLRRLYLHDIYTRVFAHRLPTQPFPVSSHLIACAPKTTLFQAVSTRCISKKLHRLDEAV